MGNRLSCFSTNYSNESNCTLNNSPPYQHRDITLGTFRNIQKLASLKTVKNLAYSASSSHSIWNTDDSNTPPTPDRLLSADSLHRLSTVNSRRGDANFSGPL